MPMRACGSEVSRVDPRCVGISPQQYRPVLSAEPPGEPDGLARLFDAPGHPRRRMVGNNGQPDPVHGGLGCQNPLRQQNVCRQPGTAGSLPVARDGDAAGADRRSSGARALRLVAQMSQSATADCRRTSAEPGLTSCTKIRSGRSSRLRRRLDHLRRRSQPPNTSPRPGIQTVLDKLTPPERARTNLDRHPNYILAAYMASGT